GMIAMKTVGLFLGGARMLGALTRFTVFSWRAVAPWLAFAAAVVGIVIGMDKILRKLEDIGILTKSKEGGLFGQLKALGQLGLKVFETGGIVPGPIGSPQPAIVHGGEEIRPVGASEGLGGGGGVTLNVNIGTFIGSDNDKRNLAEELMKHMDNIAIMKGKRLSIIE
ncbi:unnamed protein product, partial [marine sediment metagenome]